MSTDIKEKPKFKILKSPTLKRKQKKFVPLNERVKLETVLGLTVSSNAGLSIDSNSGNVAYFAGCVMVVYNPKKNKQTHFFNICKKPLTCCAFSKDGKYLATGESGHQPAVRVWDMEEMTQVAEFEGHKFGIRCVAFSPNLKYIVSVGYQHDMVVNVWNWRKNLKVASNKVAAKVAEVAFSEDGSMFVTVGNRHVKFWYLNASKSKNHLETLPLMGRNGILGEHQNNLFCGVCCGRAGDTDAVFAITEAGMLCQFNEKRILSKWVSLKTNKANALCMGNNRIFVGCSEGIVRVFSSSTLNFVTSVPLPHYLGVDVAMVTDRLEAIRGQGDGVDRRYADTIAVRYDEVNERLACVYNDHSIYIWDISDIKKIGKSRSFLFHSGAVWGVDVFPGKDSILPSGCFATCGNDDTIRFWKVNSHSSSSSSSTPIKKNIYSNELLKIIYIDKDLSNLLDVQFNPAGKTDKTDLTYQDKYGIRCIKFRPDGKHLASGDRVGNIRIHDLETMTQLNLVEAHDSEVLCLEFTPPETGMNLLVSGSRDRLVHVFDAQHNYTLIQTLDEHSAAVTSVKFLTSDLQLGLISCSVDKSILFRSANVDPRFHFALTRHVVSRTTLYDMDVDASKKFVVTACQDRNIRIYNSRTGKQKKCYNGSVGTEGTLVRLELDPSSAILATSSSDKNVSFFDFFTGECQGYVMGHSEVPTGVKFMGDDKHVVSSGAEGCVFLWKLNTDMIEHILKRKETVKDQVDALQLRRTTFTLQKDKTTTATSYETDANAKPNGLADDNSFVFRFSPGQLPAWARLKFSREAPPKQPSSSSVSWNVPLAPKGKWAQNVDPQNFPLPPQLPYGGWKDFLKSETSPNAQVPVIQDEDDGQNNNEIDNEEDDDDEDDDEFSEPSRALDVICESEKNEDGEEEDDGGNDADEEEDDGEKESNDNDETSKEETIFLPIGDPAIESNSDNNFKVEENDLIKFTDGAAGDGENYLSFDEDAEIRSFPPSPTSSEKPAQSDACSYEDKDFDITKETFEMTLKKLEVEMKNKLEASNRCSLSAKHFNNNNVSSNNVNDDDDLNVNKPSNSSLPVPLKFQANKNTTRKEWVDDTKKQQQLSFIGDQPNNKDQPIKSAGTGRRSLGGSELRLAVPSPLVKKTEKISLLSLPASPLASQSRKWASLHDVRVSSEVKSVTNSGGDDDDVKVDKKKLNKNDSYISSGGSSSSNSTGKFRAASASGKTRQSLGGPICSDQKNEFVKTKLKSILRSQTPNIGTSPALASSLAKQDHSLYKKNRKSSAVGSVTTMVLKVDQEADKFKKPVARVRSYRMATESSQAKQLNINNTNNTSLQQQQNSKKPLQKSKHFQSTPNLSKNGVAPSEDEDTVEEDENDKKEETTEKSSQIIQTGSGSSCSNDNFLDLSKASTLPRPRHHLLQNPSSSLGVTGMDRSSDVAQNLTESLNNSISFPVTSNAETAGSPAKVINEPCFNPASSIEEDDHVSSRTSNAFSFPGSSNYGVAMVTRNVDTSIELPERDLNTSKKMHSSFTSSSSPFLSFGRPRSSIIQSKSQLQRRLLPTDPASKQAFTFSAEMQPLTLVKQPKEVEINENSTNSVQETLAPKQFQTPRWATLKSPTNANITFARPPSRNFIAHSPDPLHNWVKRAELLQHQWEIRDTETDKQSQQSGSVNQISSGYERGLLPSESDNDNCNATTEKQNNLSPREPPFISKLPVNDVFVDDKRKLSASSLTSDQHGSGVNNNRNYRQVRTLSAGSFDQSEEFFPREGEPMVIQKETAFNKTKQTKTRPRVAFSPVVCMLSDESVADEEKCRELCEQLQGAIHAIGCFYDEMRQANADDHILQDVRQSMEAGIQKLQTSLGPVSSSTNSQLDRCAEDLTMKMYELIRKKFDPLPSSSTF